MWSVMWWKVVLEGNSETQTVLFFLPSISFSVCVCDSGSSPLWWQDHWRARVFASHSSIHGLPQLRLPLLRWGAHQRAVGALRCPLLVQVSVHWWRKSCFQTSHVPSVLFLLPLVLFDFDAISFFPLRQKMNTKKTSAGGRLKAFQPSTICQGHLVNLKITENSKKK